MDSKPSSRRPMRQNYEANKSPKMQRNSTDNNTTPKVKRSLPDESTLSDFFYMIGIFVLKKFVFTPTHIKIGIYIIALLIASVLKDFGWGWTLFVSAPFIFMTSCVYTGANPFLIRRHLLRIGIATFSWYFWTWLFELIDIKTGVCSNKTINNKFACKANKHEWIGFDISGHAFILMHALFYLLEEVSVFYKWEKIKKYLKDNENSSRDDTIRVRKWYKIFTPYIKINFVLIALLTLLWEIMLLATFLYYHTLLHKLIAAFIAVLNWFLTYKTFYETDNSLSPGLPGKGIV